MMAGGRTLSATPVPELTECATTGAAVKNLLELDVKPGDIMTRDDEDAPGRGNIAWR
jgi:hypothetical protein